MLPGELNEFIINKYGEMDAPGYSGSHWGQSEGANEFWLALARADKPVVVEDLGVFTKVEYNRPYDECGDIEAELIFEFTPMGSMVGSFYRITGYLDSWEGGDWDGGISRVKPVPKTVVDWVPA